MKRNLLVPLKTFFIRKNNTPSSALHVFPILVCLFFSINSIDAANITAISTGNWGSNSTWNCNCQPQAGDIITIPAPFTVTIPNNTKIDLTSGGSTTVNIDGGTLELDNPNSQLLLTFNSVINWTSGTIISSNSNAKLAFQFGGCGGTCEFTHAEVSATDPPFQFNSSGGNILPVELVRFSVKEIYGKVVQLDWQTASELNNKKFIIERSDDGRNFIKIGSVAGAGTSFQQTTYSFTDDTPLNGLNYYRLRQMDFDGSSSLSPVRSVMISSGNTTSVYPTIASSEFFVKTTADEILEIRLFDVRGQLMKTLKTDGMQTAQLDVSNYSPGHYLVVVKTTKGLSHHRLIHP